jgi:hypothetical protein
MRTLFHDACFTIMEERREDLEGAVQSYAHPDLRPSQHSRDLSRRVILDDTQDDYLPLGDGQVLQAALDVDARCDVPRHWVIATGLTAREVPTKARQAAEVVDQPVAGD